MRGKLIKSIRAADSVEKMQNGTFWTFTTKDVVDLFEIRNRWRSLRHEIQRYLGKSKYIMNYELHPKGHGWHIHVVFSRFYCIDDVRFYSDKFGFGRINCKRITSKGISDYLVKHCMKSYRMSNYLSNRVKRIRLVNLSRGLPSLSDYNWVSCDSDWNCHFDAWKSFLMRLNLLPKNIGIVKYNYLLSVGSFISYRNTIPFTEIVKEIF